MEASVEPLPSVTGPLFVETTLWMGIGLMGKGLAVTGLGVVGTGVGVGWG